MKKFSLIFVLFFSSAVTAYASLSDEDKTDLTSKNMKDGTFVVSTDENNTADSLNRISGKYDLGFSAPNQTYHSEHQYKPGPFGKEAAEDAAQNNQY